MRALTILAIGWCASGLAFASPEPESDPYTDLAFLDSGGILPEPGMSIHVEEAQELPVPAGLGGSERAPLSRRQVTLSSSFMNAYGVHSFSGIVGQGVDPALGPPVSFMRRYAGVDSLGNPGSGHWLHGNGDASRVLTVGYSWRDVQLEGSAFSGRPADDGLPPSTDRLKLDSRSARLTFKPLPNWSVQFSKGALSSLDQVVAGETRRTTISTTVRHSFGLGDWESTVAWGRNARRFRETTVGYLAESSLRLNHAHIFFGRIERAGSDELLRQDESFQRTPFKLNKLTLGYFQDVKASPTLSMDVGVLVSRYLVPSHVAPSYGNDPTACMAFVRLKFR